MNKPEYPVLFAVLLGAALQVSKGPAEGAESYPLVCRGGANMSIALNTEHREMYVYFSSAPRAANTELPREGQCAWMDRPLNADEPQQLRYTMSRAPSLVFVLRRDVPVEIESRSYPPDALEFIRPLNTGDLFYVRCRNEGDYLEVTGLGR